MQLMDAIITLLRIPENRRLANNTDRLVSQNMQITGSPVMGFLYQGLAYRHSNAPKGKLLYPALHHSLFEEMDWHLASARRVDLEMQSIVQGLLPILRACTSQQDFRDGLPECLVQALGDDLRSIERTRPEAWMLEEGTRQHKQYQKILPRIEFFTAARFLY